MAQIVSIWSVFANVATGDASKVRFDYRLDDGIPFVDFFQARLQVVLQSFHDNWSAQIRPILPNHVLLSKYRAHLWTALDAIPFNLTPVELSVGIEGTGAGLAGVETASPMVNVTLGRQPGNTTVGNASRRAGHVYIPTSGDFVFAGGLFAGNLPNLLNDLMPRLVRPLDVDEVPLITLPGFTAYPVRARLEYADEPDAGLADPDITNNLLVRGYWDVGTASYSLAPRFPRKNQRENYYGL